MPKPKRHNAKLCPLVIRERIINALAAGDSKRAIARALRVSNNTVTAVADQEWQRVEHVKRASLLKLNAPLQALLIASTTNSILQTTSRSISSFPSQVFRSIKFWPFAPSQAWSPESTTSTAATSFKPTLNSHVRSQNAQQQLKPSSPPPLNWLCQTVRRVRFLTAETRLASSKKAPKKALLVDLPNT